MVRQMSKLAQPFGVVIGFSHTSTSPKRAISILTLTLTLTLNLSRATALTNLTQVRTFAALESRARVVAQAQPPIIVPAPAFGHAPLA